MKAIYAQVSDLGIEETLKDIPKDINATYERILDVIDNKPLAQRELARNALLFIAYAQKPVSIDILALAIAAKDHTQTLDMLRSSTSTEKIILDACGNLLSIDNTNPEIQQVCFVHFSVHEFFTIQSPKLFHPPSFRYKEYKAVVAHRELAHRELAQMCITFLLILYSQLHDFGTSTEQSFAKDYILLNSVLNGPAGPAEGYAGAGLGIEI